MITNKVAFHNQYYLSFGIHAIMLNRVRDESFIQRVQFMPGTEGNALFTYAPLGLFETNLPRTYFLEMQIFQLKK